MRKILVVEDDKFLANAYRVKLSKASYNVVLVYDGEEAMDALQTDKFDLVILDIRLPDMDGMEVLGKLSKGKKVPPVILKENL